MNIGDLGSKNMIAEVLTKSVYIPEMYCNLLIVEFRMVIGDIHNYLLGILYLEYLSLSIYIYI